MTEAILIFTFSPVQSFIAEARRAADLYTGSQILVELSKAAAEVIGKERLIFPALDEKGDLPHDIPNKLVARVPFEECEAIAGDARESLLKRWKKLAEDARSEFIKYAPNFKNSIWDRQIIDATLPKSNEQGYLWETYWAAAKLENDDYNRAYMQAEDGLTAVKFTRPFAQHEEPGFKDTLSGKRQALCAEGQDGRTYWYEVGKIEEITPIKIRPSAENPPRPRERLDSIGIIKRFHPELSEKAVYPFHGFPSTSSMASASFLQSASANCLNDLKIYQDAIADLLPDKKYKIRDDDAWPYDGDLFYPETLRPKRLESDYGIRITPSDTKLIKAQGALQNLYEALKKAAKQAVIRGEILITRPSSYYSIIVLDGDSMGKHLRDLQSAEEHGAFSKSLFVFANEVRPVAEKHLAKVIYNGGDDVLAMAPLKTAFSFAFELAALFSEKTDRTASAGIAIAHHLSPLGTALRAARRAEYLAKQVDNKNAACIIALKRSGEPIEVRSRWEAVNMKFEEMVRLFENDEISSKLPFDLNRSAYALPQADDKLKAELYRLLKRHWQKGSSDEKDVAARDFGERLHEWAASLTPTDTRSPPEQLADWLALARIIAKGGRE